MTTSLIAQFIFHCEYEKNLSDKSIKAYKIDLQQFLAHTEKYDVRTIDVKISKEIIKTFIQNLFQKNYKDKSIKRKIATLKSFFNYLENEEIIEDNPFRKLKFKIRESCRHPKTIALSDIKKLLKSMYEAKNTYQNTSSCSYKSLVRDILIIEFLFATGIRVAELCNITKHSLNIKNGSLTIIGKGNKERTVHFCKSQIIHILKEYISLFDGELKSSSHFFINRGGRQIYEQSVRFLIKKYSKNANIQLHITPHMFRHSMATLLLEGGVDIRYIQHILGHASISTTQIYTKVNPEQQKKILNTKHPRRFF